MYIYEQKCTTDLKKTSKNENIIQLKCITIQLNKFGCGQIAATSHEKSHKNKQNGYNQG